MGVSEFKRNVSEDLLENAYLSDLRDCVERTSAAARGMLFFMGAPPEFVEEILSDPVRWQEEAREPNADLNALRESMNVETFDFRSIAEQGGEVRERYFRAFEYRAIQSIAHAAGALIAARQFLNSATVYRASVCVLTAAESLNVAASELVHRDRSFLEGKFRELDPKATGKGGGGQAMGIKEEARKIRARTVGQRRKGLLIKRRLR